MGDPSEVIQESVERASGDNESDKEGSRLNTAIALAVALTATFMALCNVKDGNIVQAMQQAQASSVDTWAYFQAKSTKQNLAQSVADQMSLHRETSTDLTPEAKAVYAKKIESFEAKVQQYEAEKNEIKAQAENFQKEYDRLNYRDDQFDIAEAAMSICIALFGVTALTRKRWLFAVAGFFAAFGVFMGLAAFVGWAIHPDLLARLLT